MWVKWRPHAAHPSPEEKHLRHAKENPEHTSSQHSPFPQTNERTKRPKRKGFMCLLVLSAITGLGGADIAKRYAQRPVRCCEVIILESAFSHHSLMVGPRVERRGVAPSLLSLLAAASHAVACLRWYLAQHHFPHSSLPTLSHLPHRCPKRCPRSLLCAMVRHK